MILVGAFGTWAFYSLTAGDKSFLLKGEPRMEVASRESTVGSGLTYSAAAVATKKTAAAAKKQRGRMGVGHWGPRGEVGEECQEEACIGKMMQVGRDLGLG